MFVCVCSTLAGSTIMLLTIPWLGGLILGRVDIINGEGKDKQTSKFSIKSFYKQVWCVVVLCNLFYVCSLFSRPLRIFPCCTLKNREGLVDFHDVMDVIFTMTRIGMNHCTRTTGGMCIYRCSCRPQMPKPRSLHHGNQPVARIREEISDAFSKILTCGLQCLIHRLL